MSADRVAKHRLTKRSYDAGYAREPYLPELDVSAWAKGVWQSHADTGLYDLQPGEEDLKVLLRKRK